MKKLAIMFFVAMMMVVGGFSADAFDLQRGDILVFGTPALGPDGPNYENHMWLGYHQAIVKRCGVYSPVWGDLKTWDDTSYPMGERFFWGHIEMATRDIPNFVGYPGYYQGFSIVVLRLAEGTILSKEAFIEAFERLSREWVYMDVPMVAAVITWIKMAVENRWVDWMYLNEDEGRIPILDMWNELYGIDFGKIPYPEKFGWYETTDLDSPRFGYRAANCSRGVGWSLVYSWKAKVPSVREFFLDHPERIASVDCLAPGQIPSILENKGLATIVAKLPALEGVE